MIPTLIPCSCRPASVTVAIALASLLVAVGYRAPVESCESAECRDVAMSPAREGRAARAGRDEEDGRKRARSRSPRRGHARNNTVPMHCCTVPENEAMLLRCDDNDRDLISNIDVATYGSVHSMRERTCGLERLPQLPGQSVDVLQAVREACTGKVECLLNPRHLADDPSVGQGKLLHVRWTCLSDLGLEVEDAHRDFPKLPLTAQGSRVVDADGNRVRLKGVNWSGANNIHNAPAGLNLAPLRVIVRRIRELGFNFVRFTFSTEMVLQNPDINAKVVAANPEMKGRTALEIFDMCVQALVAEGILVLIDNHSLNSEWCCSTDDCNGLWFNADYTVEQWVGALKHMAERYRDVPAVFAVGLKNEPRQIDDAKKCRLSENATTIPCQWASQQPGLSYKAAVELAGRAVLEASPHVMVSIGGLQFASRLEAVESMPVDLPSNRFMYEVHEYHWFGRWSNTTPTNESYFHKLTKNWGYILNQKIAPVLVSEFGFSDGFQSSFEGTWLTAWSKYAGSQGPLADIGGLDWAYWQLNGVQVGGRTRTPGARESYGLMNWCWTGPYSKHQVDAVRSFM